MERTDEVLIQFVIRSYGPDGVPVAERLSMIQRVFLRGFDLMKLAAELNEALAVPLAAPDPPVIGPDA